VRALVFVALAACGGARAAPVDAPPPVASPVTDGGAPDAPIDALSTLADLAARAPEVAPGMRELARGESTHAELVHAAGGDTCVRVAFSSSAPVTAHIESSSGAVLLRASEPSLGGVLAPRGPVCVRRGDGARVTFDGAPSARVRWIAWGAP
jgi:hypothetical protein